MKIYLVVYWYNTEFECFYDEIIKAFVKEEDAVKFKDDLDFKALVYQEGIQKALDEYTKEYEIWKTKNLNEKEYLDEIIKIKNRYALNCKKVYSDTYDSDFDDSHLIILSEEENGYKIEELNVNE